MILQKKVERRAVINSVLHIDLKAKTHKTKTYPDLAKYIGGVGIGSKLLIDYIDKDPIVFSVGPLNGFFPFASKTCACFLGEDDFRDTYAGGRLSLRLKFAGIDALMLESKADAPVVLSITDDRVEYLPLGTDLESLGLPGKRSVIELVNGACVVDGYFAFGEAALFDKLTSANVAGIVISGTSTDKLTGLPRYEKQYLEILKMINSMLVAPSEDPSCSGCPMGCHKSSQGETGGNVLVHSLVACIYAETIYSHLPNTFACLNSLGLSYIHEDLEALPDLVYSNIKEINAKIANRKLETKQDA